MMSPCNAPFPITLPLNVTGKIFPDAGIIPGSYTSPKAERKLRIHAETSHFYCVFM
jgi:hypothetical protein